MTETQLRQKAVNVMKSWIGFSESNGKFKTIIDLYNTQKPLPRGYKMKYTDEWCACTVTAAGIKAELHDIILGECSCSRMIELYKAKDRWMENDAYTPNPGDLIMYDWSDTGRGDNTGAPDHVGMVEKVSNGVITVIEGNRNEAVARRTIALNGRFIRGYCLPDYASKTRQNAPESQQKPIAVKPTPASSFDKNYAKEYTITASSLNMRIGPGTDRKIIKSIPKGKKVTCYGYFTKAGATVWLLVKDADGDVGYCSKKYLN